MDAIIEFINVYDDNKKVESGVICGKCKKHNLHIIGRNAVSKNSYRVHIDFTKLETRCCSNIKCDADYRLYAGKQIDE